MQKNTAALPRPRKEDLVVDEKEEKAKKNDVEEGVTMQHLVLLLLTHVL
jgi:hypothetical protein